MRQPTRRATVKEGTGAAQSQCQPGSLAETRQVLMRRTLITTLLALFATSAVAQFAPPGRPFQSVDPGLALGTQFDSLFVSCGTPINPICPRQLAPLGRPVLIHYVAAGG